MPLKTLLGLVVHNFFKVFSLDWNFLCVVFESHHFLFSWKFSNIAYIDGGFVEGRKRKEKENILLELKILPSSISKNK